MLSIPSTERIELRRITTTKIGATDLMNTRYIPSNLNFEESFTSFEILSRPTAFTTKMQVANAATGIISTEVPDLQSTNHLMPIIQKFMVDALTDNLYVMEDGKLVKQ